MSNWISTHEFRGRVVKDETVHTSQGRNLRQIEIEQNGDVVMIQIWLQD